MIEQLGIVINYECKDPVSVLGFVSGFMYGVCMNDCDPGLMGMLFDLIIPGFMEWLF